MDEDKTFQFDRAEFISSLAEAVKRDGLDRTKVLDAPCPAAEERSRAEQFPREVVWIHDGEKLGTWNAPPLRTLFRGSRVPPADMSHYPPEYVPMFHFIESHVLTMCEAFGDKTDGEFEDWYSNLRRRPDGRSLGECHDQLWRILALLLAMRPTSQAEYEAVVGQLAISARRFCIGYSSRNYIGYLRESLG